MKNLFDRYPLRMLLGVTIAFVVALIVLPAPDHEADAPKYLDVSAPAQQTDGDGVSPFETDAPRATEPARSDADSGS